MDQPSTCRHPGQRQDHLRTRHHRASCYGEVACRWVVFLLILATLPLLAQTVPYFNTFGYTLAGETDAYQIYRWMPGTPLVVALWKNTAVLLDQHATPPLLHIITNMQTNHAIDVAFTPQTFPGLLDDSSIAYCMLLPWTRNRVLAQYGQDWRLVVITSHGQIYHNFPSRASDSDGREVVGDATRFEESAVWDLPARHHPSRDRNCSSVEYHFPCLPDEAYAYHPRLNTDAAYTNSYGNGGFGKSLKRLVKGKWVEFPRFYLPDRQATTNPFIPASGFELGDKVTLLGSSQVNAHPGGRTCLFGTDDGGRNWFNIYEFTDSGATVSEEAGTQVSNWGNAIDTTGVADPYLAGSLLLSKRTLVLPCDDEKEPREQFRWGTPLRIRNISRDRCAVVTTEQPHHLATGNIIALQEGGTSQPAWAWLMNNAVSPISGGNGILFKVQVLDDHTVKLYEFIQSAFNNLPSRSVQHINRLKDGWLIGTGDSYPNSWLCYMPLPEADSYDQRLATDPFPLFRVNSGEQSIQHTVGAILYDDRIGTLVYADVTGVYRGVLAKSDDAADFTRLLPAHGSATFLKELEGMLIFADQQGVAISLDRGTTWSRTNTETPITAYYGENMNGIVVGHYLIHSKR